MAKFVQIIEFESKDIDAHIKIDEELVKSGHTHGGRGLVCADRDNKGRYFVIVEFPSYEEAEKSNADPEIQKNNEAHMAVDGGKEPTFYNLDVLFEG